ncbi:hypothetical protein BDV32DRAFT_128300 [Aspergillus pseudonomiae]|nr:hypothetical protein BDV32DRAFT_128300 [Aspergillus pseudonomiae]
MWRVLRPAEQGIQAAATVTLQNQLFRDQSNLVFLSMSSLTFYYSYLSWHDYQALVFMSATQG